MEHKWEETHLPPIPDHQAKALDPVDPGTGDCQIDGLASLHLYQVSQVLGHEDHVGIRLHDHPQVRLPKHQPHHPLVEELEKGLDDDGTELAGHQAALMHTSTKGDDFGQSPVELDQTFYRDLQHLEKAKKRGTKTNAHRVSMRYP
ncbi:unnamed protein product [Caretta caretta]